ncbi:hypothetical protein [Rhodobaculum claviforme]|uniref:Uncharacterized protein n=1 Tax=Rhodobaculum claviforme TaxID=1549854 RepID=A0A934TIZ6_9RHOB|nr:hypothetical protein [Rhodobaculum claviforme]MBK5926351.1 hypothetical protein [Rhodobaculum claviforme]
MTALRKYQRLECDGLWRAAPGTQRRDVVVAFGEASLILSDVRSGVPLAHWSLPAVTRRNPSAHPALFSPDAEAGETLEIDDTDMIDALETVATALRRGGQGRGRIRPTLTVGVMVALGLAVLLWLPGALVDHAVRTLPGATRAEIGAAILGDLAQAGHPVCGAPLGLRALGRLQDRLGVGRLVVLDGDGAPAALALPGGIVALGRPMIESHDSPEIAAGHALAAATRAEAAPPLRAALRHIGTLGTLRLLTTGEVEPRALRGHGAARIARPLPAADPATLLARFATAEVPVAPWARATGGPRAARLIEGDPFGDTPPVRPLLSDSDWVALQDICQR